MEKGKHGTRNEIEKGRKWEGNERKTDTKTKNRGDRGTARRNKRKG